MLIFRRKSLKKLKRFFHKEHFIKEASVSFASSYL
jgi:hypothetical protein